jgi:hypothetical protein
VRKPQRKVYRDGAVSFPGQWVSFPDVSMKFQKGTVAVVKVICQKSKGKLVARLYSPMLEHWNFPDTPAPWADQHGQAVRVCACPDETHVLKLVCQHCGLEHQVSVARLRKARQSGGDTVQV